MAETQVKPFGRKYKRRIPTTCVPCYTRKQRCDRQYPCAQCTKRRRPEECVYDSSPADTPSSSRTLPPPAMNVALSRPADLEVAKCQKSRINVTIPSGDASKAFTASAETESCPEDISNPASSAFGHNFGYSENSRSNTMALLRKWNVGGGSNDENGIENILPGMSEKIQQDLERAPPPQVLDFLLQYFINELNWMKQIVHRPSFVAQYQRWCSKAKPLSVVRDVEFTVLILRICAYSAQFLPSPSETIDKIGGLPLCNIRKLCSELGESLAETCLTLDWKGSVIRVQHILFAALVSSCEGKTGEFWERIGLAGQAAQKAGLEAEIPASGAIPGQDCQMETRSRVLSSLYIFDSHLSRQLDRIPFLSNDLVAKMMACLRLIPESVDSTAADISAPDEYMERLMQVQLGRFWRSCWPDRSEQYDPTQGEHRYERFCTEYLPTLTPAFALEPDTRWDKLLPKLSMQRQLLHIAIFDSVCWNFRPLLLLTAAQLARLPAYKRFLIQTQRERLAIAALRELEAVSALHSMFGGSQIRFSAIIFNTFEAAVLLLCLSSQTEDSQFLPEEDGTEFLGARTARPRRAQMMQAVETALRRLKMLSEVSEMAASGTKVIGELLNQAARDAALQPTTGSSSGSGWPGTVSNLLGTNFDSDMWISSDQSHESFMNELLSNIGNQESGPEFQFPYNFGRSYTN